MAMSLPQSSEQSIASILHENGMAIPVKVPSGKPAMTGPSSSNSESDIADRSPTPSPIASPHFDMVSCLNGDTADDVDFTVDGLETLQSASASMTHTSESEQHEMEDIDTYNDDGEASDASDPSAHVSVHSDDDSDSDPSYALKEGESVLGSEPEPDIPEMPAMPAELQKVFAEFLKTQRKKGKLAGSESKAKAKAKAKSNKSDGGKKKKTAAEKKDERLDIRQAVDAERRIEAPTPTEIKMDGSSTANPTEESEIQPQKRAKTTEVGGLAKDWRNVITAQVTLGKPLELPAPAPGVIGKAGKAATKRKEGNKGQAPNVVLQEADVQELDKKERAKKKNWKNQHLPFDNIVRDLPIWQQKLIPSLLDWAMSDIAEPFGTTNHADFKPTVQTLWKNIFSHLSEKNDDGIRADHPAIYSVAAAAVRTHRSDIGKEALRTIERNWGRPAMATFITPEQCGAWVTEQLKGSKFLYQYPEREENRGTFHGPLILETLAVHLQATMNVPQAYTHGNPIAAVAVTSSAVKRALTLWKSGVNSAKINSTETTNSSSKITETSFKDNPWGTVANKYYKHLCDFDDDKWQEIVLGSAHYLNVKKNKHAGAAMQPGSNEDDMDDGDDNITKSP
ncbi:hypothetical protein ARMSODRAFT_1017061 [Armillaria solidipes]|uniref:DUF6532 domain-containing protein n=1 Tax=Armillaria solidipes TaxID=1076256 RepID=A0A2H3BYL8_9AGAR|nr:hypothetical protein ARMSODRAFT_1017061 [Armillaria solidipes]